MTAQFPGNRNLDLYVNPPDFSMLATKANKQKPQNTTLWAKGNRTAGFSSFILFNKPPKPGSSVGFAAPRPLLAHLQTLT